MRDDYNRSCHFCFAGVPLSEHERIQADARALWSVRVLDAWAKTENYWRCGTNYDEQGLCVLVRGLKGDRLHYGATPDAARLAADRSVYPTLPEDVRREIGEEP